MAESKTTGISADEDFRAQVSAYLRIFQAVLKKIPVEESVRLQRYKNVQDYIQNQIKTPEHFLEGIPQFAKLLGINSSSLSTFIGTNFISALTKAREQIRQKPQDTPVVASQKSPPPATSPGGDPPIFVEIFNIVGPILQPSDRFESMDMGLMKLKSQRGDRLPKSAMSTADAGNTDTIVASSEGVSTGVLPGAGAGSASSVSPATETGKNTVVSASGKKPQPFVPEVSIFKELLEKFGSQLHVKKKLEPAAFPEGMEAATEESPAQPSLEAQTAGSASATPTTPIAPVRPGESNAPKKWVAPLFFLEKEEPIFPELKQKFSSILNITSRLEPSSGIEFSEAGEAEVEEEEEFGDTPENGGVSDGFPPLEMGFSDYLALIRKLQSFQSSGDQAGYRTWMSREAALSEKSLVALRNLDAGLGSGSGRVQDPEYAKIVERVGADSIGQVREFHEKLRLYAQIHRHLNQFQVTVKQNAPQAIPGLKQIWTQFILMAGQPGDIASRAYQLSIMLLAVPEPEAKDAIKRLATPFFEELEKVYSRTGLK